MGQHNTVTILSEGKRLELSVHTHDLEVPDDLYDSLTGWSKKSPQTRGSLYLPPELTGLEFGVSAIGYSLVVHEFKKHQGAEAGLAINFEFYADRR